MSGLAEHSCKFHEGNDLIRKTILLAAAVALAVGAGSAAAKTVTVTITKNGYVPNSVAIGQGDTVQFTNSDTVAHQSRSGRPRV